MTPPIDPSSLIFPTAAKSINITLTQLKRANLSITNRLHSIASDATFVRSVQDHVLGQGNSQCGYKDGVKAKLPMIANERCGSWYIPADHKDGSAYFKSTDGHHGQWAFSLRRLNLQVFDAIYGRAGCIIVDSTRKGKSMPDALAKTVPIWICVLNRLLFPNDTQAGVLRTPSSVVSPSEHAQIEQRIPSFVEEARSLSLDLPVLRSKLSGRPMQPVWVTPNSRLALDLRQNAEHNLIILCTASSRSSPSSALGSAYVQGAGDDSESWALGLDAATFWAHRDYLLSTSEDNLPEVIAKIVAESRARRETRAAMLVRPTSNLWIGSNATAEQEYEDFDMVVSCSEKPSEVIAAKLKDHYTNLSCTTGKVGSRQLRAQLVKIRRLKELVHPTSRILVTCHTGKDLAVGVALALLCRIIDGEGTIGGAHSNEPLSKPLIKHRLSWIMVSIPDAAPSRATLQSVNAYLLE